MEKSVRINKYSAEREKYGGAGHGLPQIFAEQLR
jgi:hypothetical protein